MSLSVPEIFPPSLPCGDSPIDSGGEDPFPILGVYSPDVALSDFVWKEMELLRKVLRSEFSAERKF